MNRFRLAVLASPAILLSGCVSLAPDAETPQIVQDIPQTYAVSEAAGEYRPAGWWRAFGDPVLDGLVDDALRDNLDIAEAAARVEQASAQARIARSALLPSISASAGSNFSSTPIAGSAFGDFGGGSPIDRIESENYTLGLGASYEIDLFGRVRGDLAAARGDALAAEYDYRSVQLAAAAETINAYFEIVDQRRQIELTLQTADLLTDRVARTDERFRRGLADSFELYQFSQDLRNVQASLPEREAALRAANGRLATLVREYPEGMQARLDRPLTPRLVFAPVPAGLPARLLDERPDVAAAWANLEAARQRIGARKAERYPSISLSGSLGTQGPDPAAVFDFGKNWALSLVSSIAAPIFDGGRISANIASARAVYDQRAAAYARTVLTAYREVDVALDDYEERRQRYTLITAQLADAQASRELQARRFRAGVGGYVAYLDALRAEIQVEASLSSAARDVALSRLGIHRALGGDWTSATTEQAPTDQSKTGEPQ